MKVKRLKHSRRVLAFYEQNFGFHKPYNVLVDGTFCMAALKGKVDIELQVKKYLCAEVKIATTHCALKECFELGPQLSGAHKILKKFRRHKCGHENAAVDADTCFKSMLGTSNPEQYICASQDAEFRKSLRAVTGIPLLYLSACTLFLESPSYESRDKAEEGFRNQDLLTEFEKETLGQLNKKEEVGEKRVIKRKRGPKGPNPLSCKKKKTEGGEKKKKKKKKVVDNSEAVVPDVPVV